MADCNEKFLEFNSRIRLTDSKRASLQDSRDTLRTMIRNNISMSNPDRLPEFQGQGSYVMDTIVNPLGNRDYDLDDGVYFFGTESVDGRPAPSYFHNLLIEAIGNHTDEVIDKDTCVRVKYSQGFHIDFPVYYAERLSLPDLAHKKKGWTLSNPIEFVAWFEEKTNSGFDSDFIYESDQLDQYRKWMEDIRKNDVQLRRIVRYIKAWADYSNGAKPCGIILTILAAQNYQAAQTDDVAFTNTIAQIFDSLEQEFVCRRPTTPEREDLFAEINENEKNTFLKKLKVLRDTGRRACQENNLKIACSLWRQTFGNRFVCADKDNFSGLHSMAASSRPWLK